MADILLTTLNAKYIHSSLGLRYLMANMGPLQAQTQIKESVIHSRPIDIVETLLNADPKIIGIGIYIWNIEQSTQVVALLKQIRPDIIVILGGPEISYEYEQQQIAALADYVICGAADIAFGELCQQLLTKPTPLPSAMQKYLRPPTPALRTIRFPYDFYTDEDIAHRIIYVEASRGCPFKCEFCLSALDKTAWPFDLDAFLAQLQSLYERGARRFKFVDRTFNLKVDSGVKILEFFLQRLDEQLFLHFEVIPDHLPERLQELIQQFPPGSLQFEIGIQSFNPEVQQLISRKQNNQKSKQNLSWLRQHSQAHIHADLIAGLPGENLESFAQGFNELCALQTHEIQVGILKRLRGSPICRHSDTFLMRYNPHPPYNILSTSLMDFGTLQRLSRFARYWDMIANSGRFSHTLTVLLGDNAFARFMALSDWIYTHAAQTHKIALERLFILVYQGLTEALGVPENTAADVLWQDYQLAGLKKRPPFAPDTANRGGTQTTPSGITTTANNAIPTRQARHLHK